MSNESCCGNFNVSSEFWEEFENLIAEILSLYHNNEKMVALLENCQKINRTTKFSEIIEQETFDVKNSG